MSTHSSSQSWKFPILLNVPLLWLQRWTIFLVSSNLIIYSTSQILLHHVPWRNLCNLSPLELILSGCLDRSRCILPYLTDCAAPSRRVSPWWGRTCWIILDEFIRLSWSIVCNNGFEDDTIDDVLAKWFIIGFVHFCDSFFSWNFLKSFCHCSGASCRNETTDIKQSQQLIPIITRETSFGQIVSFFVSMYLIYILESRLIRSNNQSSAILWVQETCLIVETSAFHNHFNCSFIILKHIQQSFLTRGLDVWRNQINVFHHIDFVVRLLVFLNIIHRFPRSIWNTRNISKDRNN